MHFLKENSYTSLRQLCDEAEAGMRSMATVLVLDFLFDLIARRSKTMRKTAESKK